MLKGASWLYGKIIDSRNSLYERGVIQARVLPAPTISVGNITAGGTGKTPLVAHLAELLAAKGEVPCIISRGYGRRDISKRVLVSDKDHILATPSDAGDEPFELAKRLVGKAFVIADRDRIAAASWAHEEFGITAFILDDAFQHRRAARDLDIVVIDSTNPLGNQMQLPAGVLREDPANLARADIAVLTRYNLCRNREEVNSTISRYAPLLPQFTCETRIEGFRSLEDFQSGSKSSESKLDEPGFAFCGIGNPENFFAQLKAEKIDIRGTHAFADHQKYSLKDFERIEKKALTSGAKVLITTAKDAVKLEEAVFSLPCFVCETRLEFEDEKGLEGILAKSLRRSRKDS